MDWGKAKPYQIYNWLERNGYSYNSALRAWEKNVLLDYTHEIRLHQSDGSVIIIPLTQPATIASAVAAVNAALGKILPGAQFPYVIAVEGYDLKGQ